MSEPARKNNLKINLNLLYPQGIPQKIYLKFLRWLLNYGKYILLVVEIIVIAAVVYRFKLDNDLSQLNKGIKTQLEFIKTQSQQETLIRQFQFRLQTLKTDYNSYPRYKEIMGTISSQMPKSMKLVSINFERGTQPGTINFKISGQTPSNNDLASFLNFLKSRQPDFTNINLTTINYEQGQFAFTITGGAK